LFTDSYWLATWLEGKKMDVEWVLITLNDVADTLADTIVDIEEEPLMVKELLERRIPEIYAKLNYAWHSRELAAKAIEQLDHDQLVAFPIELLPK
jgi:hypothetical protein